MGTQRGNLLEEVFGCSISERIIRRRHKEVDLESYVPMSVQNFRDVTEQRE